MICLFNLQISQSRCCPVFSTERLWCPTSLGHFQPPESPAAAQPTEPYAGTWHHSPGLMRHDAYLEFLHFLLSPCIVCWTYSFNVASSCVCMSWQNIGVQQKIEKLSATIRMGILPLSRSPSPSLSLSLSPSPSLSLSVSLSLSLWPFSKNHCYFRIKHIQMLWKCLDA